APDLRKAQDVPVEPVRGAGIPDAEPRVEDLRRDREVADGRSGKRGRCVLLDQPHLVAVGIQERQCPPAGLRIRLCRSGRDAAALDSNCRSPWESAFPTPTPPNASSCPDSARVVTMSRGRGLMLNTATPARGSQRSAERPSTPA